MSVVGEFRRILGETTASLRELEIGGFAEELEAVATDADDVSSAAAAVLELVGSRAGRGVLADAEASGPAMPGSAPERFAAATEHLTAVCKVILGRT